MPAALLRHGEFFGIREATRDARGYSLSIKTAHAGIVVERHTHEDAHFVLLLDGHYLSSARGAGHLHAEPALIYNPPGTTHRDTFPERCGRFLGISLASDRLAELAQLSGPSRSAEVGPMPESAQRIWDPSALALAHRIGRAMLHEPCTFALETSCLELVSSLLRGLRDERRPPAWLRTARAHLHDRAHEELTMAEISRSAGVHPVHLARAFRRFYGCSPGEYLRRVRVERVAWLLRTSITPLAEVAATCGFTDQSHLTRAFRASMGITPGAYRRRHA